MAQFKRDQVMTGPLPDDFLRLPPSQPSSTTVTQGQTPGGQFVAQTTQGPYGVQQQVASYAAPMVGVLSLTVAQVNRHFEGGAGLFLFLTCACRRDWRRITASLAWIPTVAFAWDITSTRRRPRRTEARIRTGTKRSDGKEKKMASTINN